MSKIAHPDASKQRPGPQGRGWRPGDRVLYVLASVLILIPCLWQSRIQAGDLSSHVYNAWLARQVETGQAPGLVIAAQRTNVLFDLVLKSLCEATDAGTGQRLAVSLAVLVFIWGAFAFISTVASRRAWHVLPVISMLAYGWTFHMGLFNFYISLGLCFGALALTWMPTPARIAGAVALIALAYVAHGLPVLWALAVAGHHEIARRLDARRRVYLLFGSFAGLVVGTALLHAMTETRWIAPMQFRAMLAADQLWVFDSRYLPGAFGVLLVWGILLAELIRKDGAAAVVSSVPFQLCALTSAGILLIPTWIRISGFSHALVYVPDRMSLALGVCLCALVSTVRVRRFVVYSWLVLAVVFFGCLYSNEAELNLFEDRIERLVQRLPPGQRVVLAIDGGQRVNAVPHMIDRVCIGRCYSYGNYEPSSGQFRLRVAGRSPVVISSDVDASALASGTYIVQESDLPLYEVLREVSGNLVVRSLAAGQPSLMTSWK